MVRSGWGVYTKDKQLIHEPSPTNRSDAFWGSTRFLLEDAIKLATDLAPFVIHNGVTAQGAIELEQLHEEEAWGHRFKELREDSRKLLESDARYRETNVQAPNPV